MDKMVWCERLMGWITDVATVRLRGTGRASQYDRAVISARIAYLRAGEIEPFGAWHEDPRAASPGRKLGEGAR